MTIHDTHPFADSDPDPARRFRARVGGAVCLWTSGEGRNRAGLTVTSLMIALGEPAQVLALLDPDSDLTDALRETGRAVVSPLAWTDRDLAEAFAGTAPAPGGPFRVAAFTDTEWGPRLAPAATWAGVELVEEREVGWSALVACRLVEVEVGDDPSSGVLGHRRGRFVRWAEPSGG
ncbi:flavin reductase family protein [Nocardioides acrostichi]|uniref:Flavin reductase n=1 Tax=Nocardioides acrostichi TaxID=2784339 RepID=A0A930UYQ9_9ACTN|nr:flavin reductase family protein [Nocardioides acrostichi]MBF4160577.1 flavin reductase [Nocardioides acrostichi]